MKRNALNVCYSDASIYHDYQRCTLLETGLAECGSAASVLYVAIYYLRY